MCDQNKTDAPDPVSRMKEKLYAEAGHLRHQGELREAARAYEQQTADQACRRPSLRERVNSSFYRAEIQSRNSDRLKELADLLDRNPAIARILELIEATGV